jgi:hypothetical protein
MASRWANGRVKPGHARAMTLYDRRCVGANVAWYDVGRRHKGGPFQDRDAGRCGFGWRARTCRQPMSAAAGSAAATEDAVSLTIAGGQGERVPARAAGAVVG